MLDRCPEYPLYPHSSLDLSGYRKVLVLAPHPDDEIYGCGGLLRLLVEAGADVSVLVITDGGQGGSGPPAEVRAVRMAESQAAARVVGFERIRFMGLEDRSLAFDEALIGAVRRELEEARPDLVLAPALTERHPDHQVLALVGVEAVRQLDLPLNFAFYEVSATLIPNALVDISAVLPVKERAMACFASQEALEPYQQRILGLNRYRAYSLGAQVVAAEAFQVLSHEDLRRNFAALLQPAVNLRRTRGLAIDPAQLPLVSVIIPSADHPTLPEALASVAAQTYPRIEILVVDTIGGRRVLLPECAGRYPLRFLAAEAGRTLAAAANLGLDRARGQELVCLEEQGLLFPNHIERLVTARLHHPERLVAITDAELVTPEGVHPIPFALSFDSDRLLRAPTLVPTALLFSRTLVARGCRFDERLEGLETKDLCLQLAQYTLFQPVPGVSAQSRHADTEIAAQENCEAHRCAVLQKWRPKNAGGPSGDQDPAWWYGGVAKLKCAGTVPTEESAQALPGAPRPADRRDSRSPWSGPMGFFRRLLRPRAH